MLALHKMCLLDPRSNQLTYSSRKIVTSLYQLQATVSGARELSVLLQFLGHQHRSIRVVDYINYFTPLSLISSPSLAGAVLIRDIILCSV